MAFGDAPGEQLSDYSVLAQHYDRAYNSIFEDRCNDIALAHGLIQEFHPDPQSLLDLGTGTGQILSSFQGLIGNLVGLDIAPEMLEIARTKVPEARFVEGNMSDFELVQQFDVAICLFDAINHLSDFEQWKGLFARTEQHLNSGGIFIFDMATLGSLGRAAASHDNENWPIDDGEYRLTVTQLTESDFVSNFTVMLDGQNGLAEAATGSIYEVAFPIGLVKAAAAEHFVQLLDFDARPDLLDTGTVELASDEAARAMFVYRKP
jgi:SAM-dependent methyltransferase